MAMPKLLASLLLALIAISMLHTVLMMVKEVTSMKIIRDQIMDPEVSISTNAPHNARGGARRPNTRSHACSSVTSAAGNACVCPRGIMGIKPFALATTTGRPRKEDPNALEA
ncbi:hypothetical protein G2W53_042095 [Senna tora]|uniref:Uncharacterized protein n=1 Tax=Senna tora TaxID=362788 RepID=A0A834W3H7_9FABA|nr:hypothetical protein G2W53_042095 [Senna tora]